MKNCPKCQTKNRDDANFCQSCNYRFGTVAERAEASSPSGGTRLCPAGKHTMDPSWTICPYCTGSGSRSAAASKPSAAPSAAGGKPKRRKTLVENAPPRQPTEAEEGIGEIMVRPAGDKAGKKTRYADAPPNAKARVMGLLVTYTWSREGQILGVYEGRNVIGRSDECDICIEDDDQMSQKHAVIVCRRGRFLIDDEMSSNGTYVNDENVDEKRQLANYDEIRTGATVWRFIMIEPPAEED